MNNRMTLELPSLSANGPFARDTVAAFCAQLDPSLDELSDVKTAVSEAVTNCIVHAYPDAPGMVRIECADEPSGYEDSDRQGYAVLQHRSGAPVEVHQRTPPASSSMDTADATRTMAKYFFRDAVSKYFEIWVPANIPMYAPMAT